MRADGTWASWAGMVAAAALFWPAGARAQIETTLSPVGDVNWSATAGKTVGAGNSVLQVEAGWPGIGFTWLKGLDERSDLGFHVAFNYGLEGTSTSVTGVNLAIPYRRTLAYMGDTTIAFDMQPGISLYRNNGALFGIGGPIGIVAGVQVNPQLT